MTDKEQIMIDGVDVSKCQDFYINCLTKKDNQYCNCDSDNTRFLQCKDNPDCYYKQLTRKTQECERSRKRISDLEERIINHSNEVEEYCSRLADKNKKCEKYEQALEEVYGIIVGLLVMKDVKHLSKETNEILNIISKVKSELNL